MRQVRLRLIGTLWVVAIALGALYWSERHPAEPPAAPDEAPGARLVDVDEARVVAVRLVAGSFTVELARRGERWAVVAPPNTAVPADLVEAFLESLFAAVVLDAGGPVAGGPESVGLDEGRRIEIDLENGARRVLVVGGETPTGTAAYVRDAKGTVRVVGRNVLVYRQLLLDAARASPDGEAPTGPVAWRH